MKIGVIGGGAMGKALIMGLLRNDNRIGDQIILSTPHPGKVEFLASDGIVLTNSNTECAEQADSLFICVKPWKIAEVLKEIGPLVSAGNKEVCMIVAGVPGKELIELLPSGFQGDCSIGMPNTAMAMGKSMTFLVPLKGKCLQTIDIFEKVGKLKIVEERLLPAATALASCGIAYALRYVRAATEGGVELGFKADEAQDIVAQTLIGACSLLEIPGAHAEAEIDKVTTPGGLTIRGLNAMEKAGFTNAVIQGLKAGK